MAGEPTTPGLEELTRRLSDAFVRGDFDGAVAWFAPAAVYDASRLGLGVFEGRAAIRTLMKDWTRAYEHLEQSRAEFWELGSGGTFASWQNRGRLRDSSGSVDFHYGAEARWEHDLIQTITVYMDNDEARTAAERLAEERG